MYRPILLGGMLLLFFLIFFSFLNQPLLLIALECGLVAYGVYWYGHLPLMFHRRRWRFHNDQFFLAINEGHEQAVNDIKVKLIHPWSVLFAAKVEGKWANEWIFPWGCDAEDLRRWRAVLTIYGAQKETSDET